MKNCIYTTCLVCRQLTRSHKSHIEQRIAVNNKKSLFYFILEQGEPSGSSQKIIFFNNINDVRKFIFLKEKFQVLFLIVQGVKEFMKTVLIKSFHYDFYDRLIAYRN